MKTHLERLNESYKKFYDSYYDYLEEISKTEEGLFELSQEDTDWGVEQIKDDPCVEILLRCQNDIIVEIMTKLESKYS